MMNLAVVLSKRKKRYGPIATSIVAASRKMGFAIKFYGEELKGFKNIIIFDNRSERLEKDLDCDPGANVGWWMCDYRPIEDLSVKTISPGIGNIFLCSTGLIKQYRENFKIPVYYMPQTGHVFEDLSVRTYLKNIVFIGSIVHPKYHVNRVEYLVTLQKLGLTHIYRDRTSYDMSDIYSRVPVSLSISLPFREYTSNRLYNILAAGGFALVLYYPGMEKQFENYRHLVWFHDELDAKEKAMYYLDKPGERGQIARQGFDLFWDRHSGVSRIQNMVDIMEGETGKFYGYLNEIENG